MIVNGMGNKQKRKRACGTVDFHADEPGGGVGNGKAATGL